jgi:hypothetical protein
MHREFLVRNSPERQAFGRIRMRWEDNIKIGLREVGY